MNNSIPEKWQFDDKLAPLLLHMPVKDYLHNLTKYETKCNSKILTVQ